MLKAEIASRKKKWPLWPKQFFNSMPTILLRMLISYTTLSSWSRWSHHSTPTSMESSMQNCLAKPCIFFDHVIYSISSCVSHPTWEKTWNSILQIVSRSPTQCIYVNLYNTYWSWTCIMSRISPICSIDPVLELTCRRSTPSWMQNSPALSCTYICWSGRTSWGVLSQWG